MRDDEGASTLNTIVGVLGALTFMALLALFMYCIYRHYSIPYHHGRHDDVWGTMALWSFLAMIGTGVFTVIALEEG